MFDALLTPEQRRLRDEVRDFVRNEVPRSLLIDMDADKVRYPKEYVQNLAKRNLLGLRFPPKYGGRGLKWVDDVLALEEIGVLGMSLGCLFSLPIIVGEALNVFGTNEQKAKYLKPTLEGKLCCAEALTEPRGGSDFFGTTTVAKKDGEDYILKGQKRFVVGADGADYFLAYAKTRSDAPGHASLSAFLVDRGPRVRADYVYGLMGTRGGGAGRLVFDDVKVPAENLLWKENSASDVFWQMMIPERMTSAAGALGTARAAIEIAARYSEKRKAFGKPINKFEAVSFMVADSITLLDAARGLVYAAARTVDERKDSGLQRRMASEAKKFATEAAWEILNNSMQILGGIGYTNVYPIERLLRDSRLAMIWTGTSQIMNLIIQHEYYRELSELKEKVRDVEHDAAESDKEDEKVYE
ncbi:MAG: acyl-CoA dehydrogenase family protein [Promethearchaeati archaeon SRVP18_Atabeyarchaeia-1]